VVELQAFLGMFNYYRRFVPAAAKVVRPLTDALQGSLRPQAKIQWSTEQQQAFLAVKAATAQLVGFFLQKLSPAETRYCALDREMLAVYSSILQFRHLLEGRHFKIFSDHKPLAGGLTRVSDPPV
jgi:hypothetical protein